MNNNPTASYSLVVVNDDPTQVFFLTKLLRAHGFNVQGFLDAQQALLSMSGTNRPDLIVTDLNMPGMDGWRFCRLLRSPGYSEFNNTPILVVSATFAGNETYQTISDLGANAFMSAPVNKKDFVNKVHSLLRGDCSQSLSRVLIAEGNGQEAQHLKAAFQAHGYIADAAYSGRDVFDKLRNNTYDVVVLNHHLADMSEADLQQSIQRISTSAVCIMTTAASSPRLPMEWMSLGASAFVRKPFSPAYLIELCVRARRERALLKVEDLLEKKTRALQESEHRYRSLFQNNHTAMLIVDPGTADIVDANRAACDFYGWTRKEITSRKISDINILTEKEIFAEMTMARDENRSQFFFQHRLASGEVRDVEVFSGPIIIEGQTLLYSIIHDITKRKQVENQLLQSNADLKTAESIAQMGTWKYNPGSGSITGSEGFFKIMGNKSLATISFEAVLEIVHPEDRTKVRQEIATVLESYTSFDFEFRIIVRERTRCLKTMGAAQTSIGSQDIFVMGLIMDISEKQEMELKKRQQMEHLAQASKMTALGTLVAGVAHEVNNPNNLIMLNAPILEQVWNDSLPVLKKHCLKNPDFELAGVPFALMCEYVVRLYSGIHEGSQRISNIISELKDFARQSPLDITRLVSINEVAESALTLVEKTIARHTDRFQVNLEPDLPLIRGDFQKLEQVIVNLLLNACQSLPDKFRAITMETYFSADSDTVAVKIADQGEGIAPADLDRILDPFFTTKRKIGGTGLGLSISSSIVQDHNGTMHIDSTPGQGTTVTVHINHTVT